jgi:hypothetical protein
MNTQRLIAVVGTMAISALIAGCQRSDGVSANSAPAGSFVNIVRVSPDTSTQLKTGDKVRVQVEVSYGLTTDTGTISLVIQTADNSNLGNNMEVIHKGTGKATLFAEIVVPNSNAVQIFTPLTTQGQTSTSTVDTRAYKVVSN